MCKLAYSVHILSWKYRVAWLHIYFALWTASELQAWPVSRARYQSRKLSVLCISHYGNCSIRLWGTKCALEGCCSQCRIYSSNSISNSPCQCTFIEGITQVAMKPIARQLCDWLRCFPWEGKNYVWSRTACELGHDERKRWRIIKSHGVGSGEGSGKIWDTQKGGLVDK